MEISKKEFDKFCLDDINAEKDVIIFSIYISLFAVFIFYIKLDTNIIITSNMLIFFIIVFILECILTSIIFQKKELILNLNNERDLRFIEKYKEIYLKQLKEERINKRELNKIRKECKRMKE